MNAPRTVILLAATIAMGLVAGVFALYAHTIMPGLAKTDDRTFVGAFQAIDRAIINPWFLAGGFVGALIFTFAATITQLGHDPLPWTAAALLLYLVAFAITIAINVPLNDALKAAGDPTASATSPPSAPSSASPAGPPGTWSARSPQPPPSPSSRGPWSSTAVRPSARPSTVR